MGKTAKRKTCRIGKEAQVMVLTILALGGTILGATTIAGLLMLYQLRQAKNLIDSTKAIYAADAGIECGLYQFFQITDWKKISSKDSLLSSCNPGLFSKENGAKSQVSWDFTSLPEGTATPGGIISLGVAGEVKRAFYVSVTAGTSTLKITK